jgi:hypothetical protein
MEHNLAGYAKYYSYGSIKILGGSEFTRKILATIKEIFLDIGKQVSSLVPKVRTTIVAINNHMAIIQVQIRKNTIEDVLLDGGSRVNIIIKQLRLRLGLPKPKLAPYNLRMVD